MSMARKLYRRLPWNDEQRSRLIAMAKQFECLWLPGSNDVDALKRRRSALFHIQQHFAAEGFSLDDVKMQWRNLKDIFYKRFEQMINKAKSGEDPSRIKPSWAHFDELRFLGSERVIGEGRTRRTLIYGSIDDVERKIEQGEVEMLEREGGGETEEYDEEEGGGGGDEWIRKDGLEMEGKEEDEGKSIDDQQGMIERISVNLESAMANRNAEQKPKQQLKDFAVHPEIGDNFQFDESPMCRLSRSIDNRIHQRQQFELMKQNNDATMFDGQRENEGGIASTNHSFFGPSISSQNHNLFDQSPASASSVNIDQHQRGRKFMSQIGRKEKLPNSTSFIGQESNKNLGGQQKDRFKYFGSYVENALRDLSQQSPELARRLQQSIYSTISAHQMEATIGFDWSNEDDANN